MGIHNELGLVKLPTSNKGVAIATRSHPSLCNFSNRDGVLHCVTIMVEQMRKYNITPMAMTNCLNFGNPKNADVMGDFVESIETLNDCAKYWDLPIVSGNVSLYNETAEGAIPPTPVLMGIGLVKDIRKCTSSDMKKEGSIWIIGETKEEMGASLYYRHLNLESGNVPTTNFEEFMPRMEQLIQAIENEEVVACHDISTGGLAISIISSSVFLRRSIYFYLIV